ncbi:MAG: hypothetical protein QOF18_2664 [Frankiaceae bacterium]|jgi:uncharacterized protein (DUF427 family)|nr:hypothetical protein [Frankiaceae bacterium]
MTDQSQRGLVRVEPCARRVRAFLHGACVLDTIRAVYVWELPYYPAYYVPVDDVVATLVPTGDTEHSPSRGDADIYDVEVASGVRASAAAKRYAESPIHALRGLVHVQWPLMDEWFEEDEPVYTHPRDPYTRVDVLASSRRVRVELDGVTLADTAAVHVLFETGLPPRFYLPMTDVRMDLLEPSPSESHCPYKGQASYWSVVVDGARHDDFAWCYRAPFPESQKIAGMVCFYNEKVDLYLDGVAQPRPLTHFS